MSQLIYQGVLSSETIYHIKSAIDKGYLYWVEILRYPKDFNEEWNKKNLILYGRECEDCMGNVYHDKSYSFIVMRPFIGFRSEQEQIAFIQSFDVDIKTSNPFSMSF